MKQLKSLYIDPAAVCAETGSDAAIDIKTQIARAQKELKNPVFIILYLLSLSFKIII